MTERDAGEDLPEFPPMVYLPCQEHVSDPREAVVELRELSDGRRALLAYSSYDRLKGCCGNGQPWLVIPSGLLESIRRTQPYQLMLLDMEIPPEQRTHADVPERRQEFPKTGMPAVRLPGGATAFPIASGSGTPNW